MNELVDVTYPAKRCYAPGCGDKIKDKKMWRTEDEHGEHFLHTYCCDEQGCPLLEYDQGYLVERKRGGK